MITFKDYLSEDKKDTPPRWKKTDNDGDMEIKFPTGRRFKVEKHYDVSMRTMGVRHKGEYLLLEYDKRTDDWEWQDTYSPKGYAKQKAVETGQYDSKGNKVADYSHTFKFK